MFLIKCGIKFKSGYSFLLEKSSTINELIRHKLYDCHTKHNIFICIGKFSLQRKVTFIPGR